MFLVNNIFRGFHVQLSHRLIYFLLSKIYNYIIPIIYVKRKIPSINLAFRLIFLENLAAKLTEMEETCPTNNNKTEVKIVENIPEKPAEEIIWYQQEPLITVENQDNSFSDIFNDDFDDFSLELKNQTTDDFFKELQAQIEPFIMD